MKIPSQYIRAVNRYEPIEVDGANLYPITVEKYEEFTTARPALEFMQQTLPVRYACMPMLSAFYELDYEKFIRGEPPVGLFSRVLLLLSLSMRLGDGMSKEDRMKTIRPLVDSENPAKLLAIRCMIDGQTVIDVTPVMYARWRPIIAAQNGIELISESANPELVEAERDALERGAVNLDCDFYTLRASVAALSNCDETEIDTWPLLKFTRRYKAYQRAIDYIVCGINEGNGVKWRGGNPCPSPFYPKIKTENAGLMPLDQFAGGAGERAVVQAGDISAASISTQQGVN